MKTRPIRGRGLVFRGQSPYGEIRVVNEDEFRYLLIDGAIHTAVDTSLFMIRSRRTST